MNADSITSAAPAAHKDLTRALAERAQTHRFQDQQLHRFQDQQLHRDQLGCLPGQQHAPFGAGRCLSASHDDPAARANPSIVCGLPDAVPSSFGPIGLAGPAGFADLDGLAALRTSARPI